MTKNRDSSLVLRCCSALIWGILFSTLSTSRCETFSEDTPRNPVTNTLLRNLILPRVPPQKPSLRLCSHGSITRRTVSVDFGIPARVWQSDMLPQALDKDAAAKLPMNASVAVSLLVNGLWVTTQQAWWFPGFLDSKLKEHKSSSATRFVGLEFFDMLPSDKNTNEQAKRQWFLEQSRTIMAKNLSQQEPDLTKRALALEFTHVDVSPSITFDSVSFEVRLDSYVMGPSAFSNGTRYNRISSDEQCGLIPGICLFNMPSLNRGLVSNDICSQVGAFAVCLT